MLEQLEKILENRTTVKDFNGNPIAKGDISTIQKAVDKTPSCDNRYNFKVKLLGQSLHDRKTKVGLYDYICTLSKENVRHNDDDDTMSIRSPRSYQEAKQWQSKKILSTQINGQMLAPLILVWYFPDNDPIESDYLDVGISCWNTILTAESLGIQSGFCGCFDKECLQDFLNINGVPAVMVGFGYSEKSESGISKIIV